MLVAAFNGLTAPFVGLVLRREFDASPLQLSLGASAAAAAMLLALVWVRLTAHHPPLVWLIVAGVAGRGVFLIAPWVDSAWTCAALVAVSAFVLALPGPAYAAVVERVYPRHVRGRALAIVRAAAGFVTVAVSVGAGALLEHAGYRGAFVVAAMVGVVGSLTLLALRVPVAPTPDVAPQSPAPWALADNRAFVWLVGSSFLFGLGCWIQVPVRPVTLADVVQITPAELGWLAAAGGIAFIVASIAWGRLADRRGGVDALRLVYVVGILSTGFYLSARTSWGLLGGFIAEGVLSVGLELVWVIALIDVVDSDHVARAAAVATMLTGVRGLIGPLLGVVLVDHVGVGGVYAIAIVLMTGAVLAMSRLSSAWRTAPARGRQPVPALVP